MTLLLLTRYGTKYPKAKLSGTVPYYIILKNSPDKKFKKEFPVPYVTGTSTGNRYKKKYSLHLDNFLETEHKSSE